MLKLHEKKTSYVLDAIIVVLAVAFILVIYVSAKVWGEEDVLRDLCRERMNNYYSLQTEFYRLSNRYADTPEEALLIVAATLDSVRNDSSFFGFKSIWIDTVDYKINVEGDILARVDSIFTLPLNDSLFYCAFSLEKHILRITDGVHMRIACPIKQYRTPMKILIVQEDDSLTNVYAESIIIDDYEIKGAVSMSEANAIQSSWMPELIMVDDQMILGQGSAFIDNLYEVDPQTLVVLFFSEEQDSTVTQPSLQVASILNYGFSLNEMISTVDLQLNQSPRRLLREDFFRTRYLFFTMADSTHGYIDGGDRSWLEGDE